MACRWSFAGPSSASWGASSPMRWSRSAARARGERRRSADDGFLDRFLFSYPDELPAEGERWKEVSPDASLDWSSAVERLLGLDMQLLLDPTEEDHGETLPRLVYLSSDGRAAWQRLTQAHADEVNADDFPGFLRGAWSKLCPGYLGPSGPHPPAACAHCCGDADGDAVDGDSLDRAQAPADLLQGSTRKCYAAMDANDPRIDDACNRAGAGRRRHPELLDLSRHDAHADPRCSFPDPDRLDSPLELLCKRHYPAQAARRPGKPGPGRKPDARYEVNPLWERHEIH